MVLRRPRRRAAVALAGATALAVAILVTLAFRGSPSTGASWVGSSPAAISARAPTARHFEYVVTDHEVSVYDIDRNNRYVGKLHIPQIVDPHGVVASPATGRLYVSYGGQGGSRGNGSLVAYDLRRNRVVWQRDYDSGIDSIAITPNGRTIYLPAGEFSSSNQWRIVDAGTGTVTGAVVAGVGPHNTIMGLDGKYVYLAAIQYPYLSVASTATNKVVKRVGPLNPDGPRPFTINGSQTLAFTTSDYFLGFQVSGITSGKVLFTVSPHGFTFDPKTFTRTPDHGISLSPDERQLYLIDTPNGYVHVFDVSGLPASPPRDLAHIKLAHPPPNDGWLQHSRDGRYVYVGRAGDVIDTRTRKVVAFLRPLQQTADFLEIDWRGGKPVSTTSRYGTGYVRR